MIRDGPTKPKIANEAGFGTEKLRNKSDDPENLVFFSEVPTLRRAQLVNLIFYLFLCQRNKPEQNFKNLVFQPKTASIVVSIKAAHAAQD